MSNISARNLFHLQEDIAVGFLDVQNSKMPNTLFLPYIVR